MGNVGFFFPIMVAGCIVISVGLALLDRWLSPKDLETYERWLKEELKRNPDYIDWLKCANCGRDYRLGLKILKNIKRKRGD